MQLQTNNIFSNDLLIGAIDNSMDGFWLTDNDYHLLYTNKMALEIFGMSERPIKFKDWLSIVKVYDLDKNEIPFREWPINLILNGHEVNDFRMYVTSESNKDGLYISCNGKPVYRGKKRVGALLNFRDITQQYFHENYILEQKKFFERILNIIPAYIFVHDLDGRAIFYNQLFFDLLKQDPLLSEKILSRKETASDTHVLQEFLDEYLDPDGSKIYLRTVIFPITNDQNHIICYGGITFDETLKEHHKRLLEERMLKDIHSDKLIAIGTMAGEICHEINTPVTVIKSITFILKEMLRENNFPAEKILKKINTIEDTVERINQIVLSLNNISHSSHEEKKCLCTVSEILKDVSTMCQMKLKHSNIQFIMDTGEDIKDAKFLCYRIQLSQVLINLLRNAIDAVENQKNAWIKLSVYMEQNSLFFEVSDSGPGIPVNFRQRIFEPFFTTKELGKGTGLGLSISKNLVEAHGGEFFLHNDKNSTFVVKLPWN